MTIRSPSNHDRIIIETSSNAHRNLMGAGTRAALLKTAKAGAPIPSLGKLPSRNEVMLPIEPDRFGADF
jgi:hypothetical protein